MSQDVDLNLGANPRGESGIGSWDNGIHNTRQQAGHETGRVLHAS